MTNLSCIGSAMGPNAALSVKNLWLFHGIRSCPPKIRINVSRSPAAGLCRTPPPLHGVPHLTYMWGFPFGKFHLCSELQEKICWNDWVALCEYALTLEEKLAHIIGYVDADTAKQWLNWNFGEPFVDACNGEFVFSFKGESIVPV